MHAAVAAARAGARAAVVGRVGSDPAAAAIKDALARAGVEAQLVEDRERPSGTYVEARDAIAADRGASAALVPGDIPSPLVAGAVLVSGHALLHDDTVTAARLALTSARARHVAVVAASARLIDSLGAARFTSVLGRDGGGRERRGGAGADEPRSGCGCCRACAALPVCVCDRGRRRSVRGDGLGGRPRRRRPGCGPHHRSRRCACRCPARFAGPWHRATPGTSGRV